MPSQKNIKLLEELRQKLDRANAMFFVDYAGLTHRQMEEARRELASAESELTVIKNTLLNLALEEKKIRVEKLEGPHATLFSYKDPIATAKVLAGFIKKHGLPKVRFGIFEGGIVDEAIITKLAALPSREVLIAKLLGMLNAPISGLVYVLNGNIQKLAMVLKAVEKQKASHANVSESN
ncbi:MAG: 50S ribosomal protein L10 [Candidatus Levybacteria bacterium]|nr:50S ribosomal protein L10 [Candidatus Levybacteria bacterium]